MKTTDPQLAESLDQVGFRSEYATYQSILERAEVAGSSYAEVMTREEAKRFSVDADGELIPPEKSKHETILPAGLKSCLSSTYTNENLSSLNPAPCRPAHLLR